MNPQPEIITRRLVLRPFNPADAVEVQRLAGNFNVSKTTLNIPYPYPAGSAMRWISTHQALWHSNTGVVYAILQIDTLGLIGAVSLLDMSAGRAELGYWIGEPYWGNGYCTEAVAALIEYAFTQLELNTIYAEHLQSNPASGKVMQNTGMQYIETVIKADRYRNMASLDIYELQKLEFQSV